MPVTEGEKCFREKYWEELTSEEKIEELGRVVLELSDCLCRLRNGLDEVSEPHCHMSDGKMVKDFYDRGCKSDSSGHRRDILNRNPENKKGRG